MELDVDLIRHLLAHDLDNLGGIVEQEQSPENLERYWEDIQRAPSEPLDYFSQSEEILAAFVSNDNLPRSIIVDLLGNETGYGDPYFGVSPSIAHMFAAHLNSDEEAMEIYKRNFNDEVFNARLHDEHLRIHEQAQGAFDVDPGLKARLESVEVKKDMGKERYMHFNPADVEAVGLGWILKHVVPFVHAEYSERTGIVSEKEDGWEQPVSSCPSMDIFLTIH